jgi:hypothetical protein
MTPSRAILELNKMIMYYPKAILVVFEGMVFLELVRKMVLVGM